MDAESIAGSRLAWSLELVRAACRGERAAGGIVLGKTSAPERRRSAWKASGGGYQGGVLRKFADPVVVARQGARTHGGGKAEVTCYADV
ncbi:MAG: hypothetical protein ACOYLQ_14665 [Hyphomicrobiaceae bacterium]